MTTIINQTNLAEVSRIVGDSEVDEVRSLIKTVIQGRELKHMQSMNKIEKLKARINATCRESEELDKQHREAECQIEAIKPEFLKVEGSIQSLEETMKMMKKKLDEHKRANDDLKEELSQMELIRQSRAEAFKTSFGIQSLNFEPKGQDIEITIRPDPKCDGTYMILCAKDRARKGLHLQVVGSDPALDGFEELERSHTQKISEFVELVMKSRQLWLTQPELANDF